MILHRSFALQTPSAGTITRGFLYPEVDRIKLYCLKLPWCFVVVLGYNYRDIYFISQILLCFLENAQYQVFLNLLYRKYNTYTYM